MAGLSTSAADFQQRRKVGGDLLHQGFVSGNYPQLRFSQASNRAQQLLDSWASFAANFPPFFHSLVEKWASNRRAVVWCRPSMRWTARFGPCSTGMRFVRAHRCTLPKRRGMVGNKRGLPVGGDRVGKA